MIHLDCHSLSIAGQDDGANEDFALVDSAAGVFVVADGMGGRPGGAEASRTAVQAFQEELCRLEPAQRGDPQHLRAAVAVANQRVRMLGERDPRFTGTGCTLSAVIVNGSTAAIAHVGDSRVYLLRDGELRTQTSDHTLVAELVQRNYLPVDKARDYPLRHVLSRSLGTQPNVEAEIHQIELRSGDLLLLVTDGLAKALSPARLQEILQIERARGARRTCEAALQAAMAVPPADDITIVAVALIDVPGNDT